MTRPQERVLAIVQARMSSSRLPGKVLRPLLGQPMLERQIERLRRSKGIERLIVATSTDGSDHPIEQLCIRIGLPCFRGSLNDVLDRYYQAACRFGGEVIVRLTGDCPLIDPEIIDRGIAFFLEGAYHYVSNTIERTFPIGLDTELFRIADLREAWSLAVLPSEREHVTPYFHNHPEKYTIGQFRHSENLSHHRWTVDEPADFEFVSRVYEALYPSNPCFTTAQVLELLRRRSDLTKINYDIVHGAGWTKSLMADEIFLTRGDEKRTSDKIETITR